MEIAISDLLDKMSIIKLKIERIGETHLQKEYDIYANELEIMNPKFKIKLHNSFLELYEINAKIWDLEHEIRLGLNCELSLEEVGRRTLLIRELNKKRVRIKDIIVEYTNSGFKDVKMNS